MGLLDDFALPFVTFILFIGLLVAGAGIKAFTGFDFVEAFTSVISGIFGAFGMTIGVITVEGLILLTLMIGLFGFLVSLPQ